MLVLAIDPGPERSAWLVYDSRRRRPIAFGIETNELLAERALPHLNSHGPDMLSQVVIEMVSCYGSGLPVGKETYETCVWIGRFMERVCPFASATVTRSQVRVAICGTARAKDANVRQALVDRWGGKEKAIGRRHCRDCGGKGYRGRRPPKERTPCSQCMGTGDGRGPLYGITSHVWAALAVAVTWAERDGGTAL
jgi:hypothetical protein